MERLIPLLNERHDLEWVLGSNVNGDYLFVKGDKENKFYEEQIISKKFGFIKWLVENDKINKDLISRVLIRAYISPKTMVSLECEFHDYYESLLMLLSISDTPIEDLILYLK